MACSPTPNQCHTHNGWEYINVNTRSWVHTLTKESTTYCANTYYKKVVVVVVVVVVVGVGGGGVDGGVVGETHALYHST